MSHGQIAEMKRRGVVAVGGEDAEEFLNDLVTADISTAARGRAVYAALLTPQGKILFDFIAFRDDGRFLFDIRRDLVADFVKRLGFYKLRAKVDVADLSDERVVVAAWGSDRPPMIDGPVALDPRLAALGFRAIVPPGADMAADFDEANEADYDAHRIALGIPEGGIDFPFGQIFPHDADLDQLAGVDFTKGCYVGQEVVSRMEHRGTARRRIVMVRADSPLPAAETPVTASDRPIGALGSSVGGLGLALVRLDRAKEAIDAGMPITVSERSLTVTLPDWAKFRWPEDPPAD